MTSLDKVNNTIDTAEEMARQIYLAGLGAYGKSFEQMQSQYSKLNAETSRFFEALVAKGEKLESNTNQKIKRQTAVDKRVEEVRKKLGLDNTHTATEAKIEELTKKVDALTKAINKLS